MTVARDVSGLDRRPRAVAIGSFDGVHRGHRVILEALVADRSRTPTVITFDPHARGEDVDLLTSLERRLELLAEAGVEDVLVLDAAGVGGAGETPTEGVLTAIGVEVVVTAARPSAAAGALDERRVPLAEGVSSELVRALVRSGDVETAARLLGRPPELDGKVVSGDARGTGLGFPTANLQLVPSLVVPARGIYAGAAAGHRAAVSIGVNPHFGGAELRVEAFLLDFEGDLYGRRLLVELWRKLRDERAFASEQELVAQIARDVEETRATARPG